MITQRLYQSVSLVLATAAIFAGGSSCGRVVNPEAKQIPINSNPNPTGGPSPTQPDPFLTNYNCTSTATINPDVADGAQKTGYYKYCQSQTSNNAKYLNIALVETQGASTAQSTEALCAFPAIRVQGGQISAVVDPASGYPLGACGYSSETRTLINFPAGTQVYDAIYVVQFADAQQMQYCLYYGNPYLCPRYSAGFVR